MSRTSNTAPPGRAPDRPWLFRTYAGHSSAAGSNTLFRANLARGQTGLSVAFDLPTQTGYDSDHVLARGEVGKVGVPIGHLGDMRALFDAIPLAKMNTSMTINAPAAWLLALYIAVAEEQGTGRAKLAGTIQNAIIKEYLARGTYIFPPGPSLRLITDVISYTYAHMPRWNPINICSYHLQEAGATPVQELAFALSTACAVLDAVRDSGAVSAADFPALVGRISFFVNAGMRFVTELCKMRAFTELWDEICQSRYGVEEPKFRRFRYGVQVNSLGLTEPQPENNSHRILIEMLAVVLSKNARARAVQLPAWNEALGLPRPWDQQWSLRMQQIMAYETDLLEYGDIFDGSHEITKRVEALKNEARAEMDVVAAMGGAVAAVESGYMKQALVQSNAARLRAIEAGEQIIVGVNRWTQTEPSPLAAGEDSGFLTVPEQVEQDQIARLKTWRVERDSAAAAAALAELETAARERSNIMPPSINAARAGVTTGEWAETLRDVFGEYRAPTGIAIATGDDDDEALEKARTRVREAAGRLGHAPRLLVGKPGLDGHSNGAEQVAVRARDCGMTVLYDGIRLTPEQIVDAARENEADIIGLSILSGSHVPLLRDIMGRLRGAGMTIPVVVGGIIPPEDRLILGQMGVRVIYTPKDYRLTRLIGEIADLAGGDQSS
jgi:(2R)-ethylmalonyl-CoA mutase